MKNSTPKGAPPKRSKSAMPATADNAKTKSAGVKPDPRKVPAPTAPASVAVKAAEAIAPATTVATAEPKKAGATNPASGSKPVKRDTNVFAAGAAKPAAAAQPAVDDSPKFTEAATAPAAGAEGANTATGALAELNGKVFELWRAQGEAAVDLWRSTVSAGSLSEAVRVQTSGFRQSYETNISRWKDIAETATRAMGQAAQTIQSAITPPR